MRFLMMIALAAGLAFPAPAFASLPELARHLKAVHTMTADFRQTAASGASVSGTLVLERPGKIRFQYQKGVPLLVVADGKSLAMVDYEVNQVTRYPIRQTPLSVLLDAGADLGKYARVVSENADSMVVEAKDARHPEYGVITIYFTREASAPGGLILKGWRVLDAQGNTTQIALSNIAFNVAVDSNSFRYRDPRRTSRPGGR